MTSSEVHAFLKVYETRNFSTAAAELYVTQSSLSTKIRKLEEEVGCRLFLRGKGKRGIVPTYKGETFYMLALRYCEIERQMLELGKTGAVQDLRVAAYNSFGSYILTPVYERFLQEFPDIALEAQDLDFTGSAAELENHKIDLAFEILLVSRPNIKSFPFLSEQMVFLCDNRSSYPETVSLSRLDPAQEVYIDWTDEFVWWHRNAFEKKAKFTLSNMSQLEYFLIREGRWALVPSTAAYYLTRTKEISRREIDFEVPPRVTRCMYAKDTEKEGVIRCFLDCMRETLEDMKGCEVDFY